jgi:ribosomal protein S18 acetylase RimI-like enzyme
LQLYIERFIGERSEIRELMELADDSASEIDGYIEAGEVFVARRGDQVVGHVLFIPSGVQWEIKSIAVLGRLQRQGIGTALVRSVLQCAALGGDCLQVVVGTATADIDNLRFYQRLGFRMDRIERNVFAPDRGYASLEANGIPVCDRVWLSIEHPIDCRPLEVDQAIPTQPRTRNTPRITFARCALFMEEGPDVVPITVRPAVPEDADGIARTFLESAEYHACLDPERYLAPAAETISARYREGRQHPPDECGDSLTIVAELAGEIVGFVDSRLERSLDAMHREMIYCHVAEVAVRGLHRNQGIGGQLLRAAEDWGRRHSAEFASLEYHAANTRASEFYQRRMGYRVASITAIKRL